MIKAPDVTLLYVLFAFAVSYFVLRRFLFRPLGGILEARATEEAAAAKIHAESLERLAAEVLERASREITAETERSSKELPGRVRQLANALAEKVLGRKLAA